MASVQDLNQYLEELAAQARPQPNETAELLRQALRELAHAQLLTQSALTDSRTYTLWCLKYPQETPRTSFVARLIQELRRCYRELNLDFSPVESEEKQHLQGVVLAIRGVACHRLASLEQGIHLLVNQNGALTPFQIMAWEMEEDEDLDAFLRQKRGEMEAWSRQWKTHEINFADDPQPWGKILRIYTEKGSTIDCRTGLVAPTVPLLRPMVLSTLPLPRSLNQSPDETAN